MQNRYVYGLGLDEPLIQVSSAGVLTYLHADRQGSIIATSDSTGTVTNKSKYSPFGENAPVGTTFGFTGQRYDAETGLYYYKNRHYSPAIGRFLQTDPIKYKGGSLNLYLYVKNDPLNWFDPIGLDSSSFNGPAGTGSNISNSAGTGGLSGVPGTATGMTNSTTGGGQTQTFTYNNPPTTTTNTTGTLTNGSGKIITDPDGGMHATEGKPLVVPPDDPAKDVHGKVLPKCP